MGSKRVDVFNRGAPGWSLSSVLSLALGPFFCRPSQMFDIIGGVWGVEGLYGRMRLEGEEGGRYSCMLEIAYNDEDTKTASYHYRDTT